MKIAFILHSLKSGGAERAVSNLSLAMQKDHDVSVVLFDSTDVGYEHGGKLVDLESPSKSNSIGKAINLFKRTYLLRKLFKKEKYDAIFSFMEAAGFPSVMANRHSIVSVHDNPENLPKIYTPFLPFIYPFAFKTVACSSAGEQKLKKNYRLKNTTTIFNSVDLKTIKQKSNEVIQYDRSFILAAGRLNKQKGFDILIRAFSKCQANTELDLFILGEGEERSSLEQLIKKLGLENRVFLKGQVKNPYPFYASAEFFVLSSRHEGFPNILIEALSCECPCISFACETGPNEIITTNKNGLLVEPENEVELYKAIDLLHFNPSLRHNLKLNTLPSIQHLDIDRISNEWLKLIPKHEGDTESI